MAKSLLPKAPRGLSIEERFWYHLRPGPNGCWDWCAAMIGPNGGSPALGVRYEKGSRAVSVRGLSYRIAYGDPPTPIRVVCGNPRCVNPTHLMASGLRLSKRKARVTKDFWSRLDRSGPRGCWEWTGSKTVGDRRNPNGYGKIHTPAGQTTTHRYAWSLVHGPAPRGMIVCHHCDNPPCCNPAHLFLGTAKDNHDDMVRKGRGKSRGRAKQVA